VKPQPPNIPPIGQAPTILGQREAQQRAAVQQAMHQLAMQLYSQIAASHIASRDAHQLVDRDNLRNMAADSMTAARAYFEGIGVIQRDDQHTPADSHG
jgi:hypothetical protein